jgi:hypothetical protein
MAVAQQPNYPDGPDPDQKKHSPQSQSHFEQHPLQTTHRA